MHEVANYVGYSLLISVPGWVEWYVYKRITKWIDQRYWRIYRDYRRSA
jgi:hypothetical protein